MIIIENNLFSLKLRKDCVAESLILKSTGEELLNLNEKIPFCSLVQERPFHNEIKLMHPNKRTTFLANRVRREGDKLIVGFELIDFEAVVEMSIKDTYVSFALTEFIIPEDAYGVGCMFINPPPVSEFRFLQLPIAKKERFGDWLNAVWDDTSAVNIMSTSVYSLIDCQKRKNHYEMYASALRDVKLLGCGAALIASPTDKLLDCIDNVERDFDLPLGVQNRRNDNLGESIYWTSEIKPTNADKHIEYAKKGGFKRMLIYYSVFFKGGGGYRYNGDYIIGDNFPNGMDDVKAVIKKVKDAGIIPGLHFLHSHIGIKSQYVTPVADHRLNLTKYFTLSKPLGTDDTVIYVEENPEGSPLNPDLQVLKFGGEVIHYDSYTTEYPYSFNNCTRGHYDTNIINHPLGEIGGVLDVSEFGATSVYINERTSLQDEVAKKLADFYNEAGFEFVYFDGSEGTNPPFEFNVPYAQYRVYKRLNNAPIFCEGAAKAHFSWHMMNGGNAFDIFPANVFKEKIAEYPLAEAPNMADNFTRVDFGWWAFNADTQPDMYEYGTSKAAAYNCSATMMGRISNIEECARRDDVLEVMSRWEDVRRKSWLTTEQRELLKNPAQEYILLKNENGEYELTPYFCIKNAAGGNSLLSAYWFERKGKTYVVCWHKTGSANLVLPFNADFVYEEEIGGTTVDVEKVSDGIKLPVSCRRYLNTSVSKEEIIKAFENATLTD